MAKRKMHKHTKTKEVVMPEMQGKLGDVEYVLKKEDGTFRYGLKADGALVLSHVAHSACIKHAASLGVKLEAS